MLGIKKQFIKSMIKLEVVSSTPGKLQLYIAQIKKVEDEYKIYETYAENAIMLLKGVKNLQIDYEKGLATIVYAPEVVSAQRIYRWLQGMVDIGLDYYDGLKEIWEKQPEVEESIKVDQIWHKMKPILEKAVIRLR